MMDILEITVPPNWDAEQDLAEFESRFGEDYENLQEFALYQVDDACAYLKRVLAQALRYFLDRTANPRRVPVSALTVTETCHFLLELITQSGREPDSIERFEGHLAAVLHYEGQRALVLKRLWTDPDHAWLIELADLADTTVTAGIELDEGMVCEHDDYAETAFSESLQPQGTNTHTLTIMSPDQQRKLPPRNFSCNTSCNRTR